ncbi:Endonuclease/exonuclease/phosphatase superfamily [Sesbania bispinosa]|nr:Endonuclease/exonuclease/phosphatase superfamily [Sesbania bispinosa]
MGAELSDQEKDLLDRSKKKPKVTDVGTPCIEATEGNENPQASQGKAGDNSITGLNLESKGFLGDPLCPVVRLTDEERRGIRIPWKRSIIVKLLGRRMDLRYFQARLYKLWRPKARMEIIDLDNEYFIIRFEDLDDLQHVFDNGPLMLADHYIVIQWWQPGFKPYEDELRRVSVWIRVPGLPIEFYDNRVLWRIGNVLGKTVKIDANMLREKNDSIGEFSTKRAKFAGICIEVDLNKILISKFSLEGRVYNVEYEGLHLKDETQQPTENPRITSVAPPQSALVSPVDGDSFGPWMLVQKSSRRNHRDNRGTRGVNTGTLKDDSNVTKRLQGGNKSLGSRFSILHEDYVANNIQEQENILVDNALAINANLTPNGTLPKSAVDKGKAKMIEGSDVGQHRRAAFTSGSSNSSHSPSNDVSAATHKGTQKERLRFSHKTMQVADPVSKGGLNAEPKDLPTGLERPEVKNNRSGHHSSGSSHNQRKRVGLNLKSQVLSWNVRGTGSRGFASLICDLTRRYKVDILSILEPRMSGIKANRLIKRMGFSFCHVVHSQGFSGGLWLLWRDDMCRLEVICDHVQYIHVRVFPLDGLDPWLLTIIYASPRPNLREDLWSHLINIANSTSEAWVAIGDFNSILSLEEKHGGALPNARLISRFRDTFSQCGLLDLGFVGPSFTWEWSGIQERPYYWIIHPIWDNMLPSILNS